jgi:hypothetical protein
MLRLTIRLVIDVSQYVRAAISGTVDLYSSPSSPTAVMIAALATDPDAGIHA